MKEWKCPDCKRERTTEDNKVIVVCPSCCSFMEEVL